MEDFKGPNTLRRFNAVLLTRFSETQMSMGAYTNLRGAGMKEIFYDAAKSNKNAPIKPR